VCVCVVKKSIKSAEETFHAFSLALPLRSQEIRFIAISSERLSSLFFNLRLSFAHDALPSISFRRVLFFCDVSDSKENAPLFQFGLGNVKHSMH
jgi:hypothetical protein